MTFFTAFHFLRPWWLLALLPIAFLCYQLWRHQYSSTGLEHHINANLLQHLTTGKQQRPSPLLAITLGLIGVVLCLSLAGPTWKKRPQPLYQSESAVVILLDLSPSMRAGDIKPTRIAQAHLKIHDFLKQRKEGLTALIVYGGEAHIVTPMTDDTDTISNLLPTLTPDILPIAGSNIEMAITMAKQVVRDSNLQEASLLLLTDGINESALPNIRKQLTPAIDLTIIGIGTDAGAPIPYQGDFLKDDSGKTVIVKRNSNTLKKLTSQVNGYYLPIQNDTSDTDFFLQHLEQRFSSSTKQDNSNRTSDNWYEFGPTLILFVLPFVALLFRKGWLLNILLVSISISAFTPLPAQASLWESLWKNKNQRGTESFKQQDYHNAEKQFTHPQWKGSAHYKSGNYESALPYFEQDNSATGAYNRGNALTHLQRYEEAIAAYDDALEKKPNLASAKKNKKLVEALKKQQEQEQQKEQEKQEQQEQQNKGESSSSSQGDNRESNENNNQGDDNNANQQQDKHQQGNNRQSDNNQNNNNQNSGDQNNDEQNKNSAEPSQKAGENPESNNETHRSSDQSSESSDQAQNNIEQEPSGSSGAQTENVLSTEQQQALQQWLRKIPDNPSGLLRRKFEYEFRKRKQLYQQGKWKFPENDAHRRY